ncbi:MAG: type II toxin-antitoxin system RelE/ParE family toxin [Thermoanaerobaculales bacterium]|nr:type II toxin-antitoxin system RelE/ParE family toxin [Thermoanaerobaculales bacterium]
MSPSRFVFHPAAIAESRHARLWYEGRSHETSRGFLAELARGFDLISKHPEACQRSENNCRRYVMRTYPYVIVYRTRGSQIEVVAVAHQHQRPGYWGNR